MDPIMEATLAFGMSFACSQALIFSLALTNYQYFDQKLLKECIDFGQGQLLTYSKLRQLDELLLSLFPSFLAPGATNSQLMISSRDFIKT